MSFPQKLSLEHRPFRARTAFLLNANARAVSPRLAQRLSEVVPQGDLFLSRSFEDAEAFLRTILLRGYGQLFVGGGDGTLVGTLNLLERIADEMGAERPRLGILKLGTGNAVARVVGAKGPLLDAWHVVQHGPAEIERVHMVVCEDGTKAPFAGFGYDGEIVNDYIALKQAAKGGFGKRAVESVFGYLGAMLFCTVPRHFVLKPPTVRIFSTEDAFRVVAGPSGDEEVRVPAGTVLYEGLSPIVSVGTVPFFGFGFTMFPFARRKEGYMQLRCGDVPIATILANLFPSVWKGRFRHPRLCDFLVKDVIVEGSDPLPYQVGGDAKGEASRLVFKVSEEPVELLSLGERVAREKRGWLGLLPAPSARKV